MKFNTNNIIFFIVLVVAIGVCNIERQNGKQYSDALTAMQDTSNHYKHAYKVGNELIDNLKEDNETLKKQLKDYKNVTNITTIKTVTKIDTIFIPYSDTIPCVFTTTVDVNDTYYKINATVSNEGLGINLIKFPNESSIIVGDKKIKGFLGITKGTEYSISVEHTNPYMFTTGISHYTITTKKKWYQTTPFLIGAGFIGGVLIAK
ncbi:hypothetical protein H8D85_02230 [bacterium]|nr:hypothetical protein [bacterium]